MDEKLRTAFITAAKAAHESGSVQIHVGPDIVAYLRSLATQPNLPPSSPTLWGFPVVEDPRDGHVSVHVVHTIA